MKLLDKIKNAIFEEEEFDDTLDNKEPTKEEKKEEKKNDEIVKKIDIEKTIPKKIDLSEELKEKKEKPLMRREMRRTPVIFDEEDFVMEEPKQAPKPKIEKKKEEIKKPLYGGYRDDKTKEKFKPSPIISPVYGFVGVSPVLEHARVDDTGEKHIFIQDKKDEISLDAVRKKAFGKENSILEEDDDLGLLYEMKKEEKAPAISKITLGDAEEYFEDLGLEYNIDYKDEEKEKKVRKETSEKDSKTTRSTKNKELSDKVETAIKKEKELESTKELEITKEQLKPKTAKEIKKVKKIDDIDLGMSDEKEEAEEKNLYDLIDMMYDSK